MIFETHAHYDDEQFQEDRDALLEAMPSLGVGTIVNVSATYESCLHAVELAKKMAEEEKKRKAKQAEDEKIKGCAADMQHTLFGQNYRSVFMQSYRESVFRSEIL